MNKLNFDIIKEHVGTKYGDLTGVIQIDGHSNISSIYDLCKDHEFETDDKFIVGFGFGESTILGISKNDSIYCSILYVEKSEYGHNFEAIEEKIKKDKKLILKKENIEVKYSKLGKYIKRFDFLAMTELTKYATKIEIEEE